MLSDEQWEAVKSWASDTDYAEQPWIENQAWATELLRLRAEVAELRKKVSALDGEELLDYVHEHLPDAPAIPGLNNQRDPVSMVGALLKDAALGANLRRLVDRLDWGLLCFGKYPLSTEFALAPGAALDDVLADAAEGCDE